MFNFLQNKLKAILLYPALLVCGVLLGFAIAVYGHFPGNFLKDSHDDRPVVAVLNPVGDSDLTFTTRMTVTGTLVEQILLRKKYRIVNINLTDQIQKEREYTKSGLVLPSEVRSNEMLAPDIVCTSALTREEGGFFIACSLIYVKTGEVFATATELIATDSHEEIKKSIERAAKKMLGG